jgi:DNA polymerase I-like protein with 3'-5' exonuclease and polymerase domains
MLIKYSVFGTQSTVIGKDVPMLRAGNVFPVHTRFGLAASGRRTSSSPNVQNPRRLAGVRECFRPRPGHVYAQADVEGLELCTLAQTCIWLLGESTLAKMINEGVDPHTSVACRILSIPYEEGVRRKKLSKATPEGHEFDNARQTGKVANFGMPGGLGAASLVKFAKATYQVTMTEDQARSLKDIWFETLPEMREYFRCIDGMSDAQGLITLQQHKSLRIRGRINYTAACNTYFQGLGADAMGDAGFRLLREQHIGTGPLRDTHTVNDVHDEFIVECLDNAAAHDVAKALEGVIVTTLTEWIPDVRISAPPMLMRYWSKSAQATYDENKRLVPWSGEQ